MAMFLILDINPKLLRLEQLSISLMNFLIDFSLLLESEKLKLLSSCNIFVTYAEMLVSFKLMNHFLLICSNGLKEMPLNLSSSILMVTKDSLDVNQRNIWAKF